MKYLKIFVKKLINNNMETMKVYTKTKGQNQQDKLWKNKQKVLNCPILTKQKEQTNVVKSDFEYFKQIPKKACI